MTTTSVTDSLFEAAGIARTQTQTETKRNELGLDDFFELMITQLKNQDPMEPMQNGEFLSQIAQFATVSGVDKLNQTFTDLSASLTSGQAVQAGSLVGHEVLVPGASGVFDAGTPLRGVVALDASAADVVLHIYNSAGALVRDLPLGSQSAGDVPFTWDGMTGTGTYAPAGTYTVVAEASANGASHALGTALYGRVTGVNLGDENGLTVDLAGLGTVPIGSVLEIH